MQKPLVEYVLRIYQDKQGEELIKLLHTHKSVKDCKLVGVSNLSLSKIKYAHELQKEEHLRTKFKEIFES